MHLWLKDAQRSSLFIKLMHQVQDIARGAAEPVEPQHDQLVAGVHKLHDRFQFRAPAPRGTRSGLGTDNLATCILEEIGSASCRERVCPDVRSCGVAVY